MLRILRLLIALGLLCLVVGASFVLWLVEPMPGTTGGGPPKPEDIAATRRFLTEVRSKTFEAAPDQTDRVLTLSETDANGILRVATRMFPAGHAEVHVLGNRIYGIASVRVPWPGADRWLNVEGVAPEFKGRPRLDHLAIGDVSLPPAPFIEAARLAANAIVGGRAGDVFLNSAKALAIVNGEMHLTLSLAEDDKKGFMRGVFGAMRGHDMPPSEAVDEYYIAVRQAIDDGTLPDRGSYLPVLRFMLTRVLERSTDATLANEYTAGMFGLAKACGAQDFALVVGRLVGDPLDSFGTWRTGCSEVVFANRIDTRRHFTTAAAIRAASNRGVSVSVGEFKELYDSLGWKQGGFDFSDIGANQSGIRLSDRIMAGTRADLAATLALMQAETDVLVDISQLPQIMPRPEFEARFGSIDSPEYAQKLIEIERLIDQVPIHMARP
jgi:hypothetical protein